VQGESETLVDTIDQGDIVPRYGERPTVIVEAAARALRPPDRAVRIDGGGRDRVDLGKRRKGSRPPPYGIGTIAPSPGSDVAADSSEVRCSAKRSEP
jgi:hypothetical protein